MKCSIRSCPNQGSPLCPTHWEVVPDYLKRAFLKAEAAIAAGDCTPEAAVELANASYEAVWAVEQLLLEEMEDFKP